VRSFYDLATRKSSSARSTVCILLSPLSSLLDGSGLVRFPVIGNGLVQRVINVGGRHEGLDREKHLIKHHPPVALKLSKLIVRKSCERDGRLTALIWRAGDHFVLRMSRQIRPILSKTNLDTKIDKIWLSQLYSSLDKIEIERE
jgi:hypothetical protein